MSIENFVWITSCYSQKCYSAWNRCLAKAHYLPLRMIWAISGTTWIHKAQGLRQRQYEKPLWTEMSLRVTGISSNFVKIKAVSNETSLFSSIACPDDYNCSGKNRLETKVAWTWTKKSVTSLKLNHDNFDRLSFSSITCSRRSHAYYFLKIDLAESISPWLKFWKAAALLVVAIATVLRLRSINYSRYPFTW